MHWEAHDTEWTPEVELEGTGQLDLSLEATHGVNSSDIFGRQTHVLFPGGEGQQCLGSRLPS